MAASRSIRPLPPLLSGAVTGALWLGIVFLVITQLLQQFIVYGGLSAQVLHLGGAAYVVVLDFLRRSRSAPKWVFGALCALAVVTTTVYFYMEGAEILARSTSGTMADLIFTTLLLGIVFIFTYYAYGIVFPLIGLLAIAYALFGQVLPEPLTGPNFTLKRVLSRFAANTHGGLVILANDFIWLLLFWGMLLPVSGAATALMQFARWISRLLAGGPAMISVVSSALAGSFTGAGPNNAAITGPLTIPAMKHAGYKPETAAAIEAVASNGATVTPPILGAVAFIMADVLGMSYIQVVVMAIVPALLWYIAVGTYVIAHAQRAKGTISTSIEYLPGGNPTRSQTLRSTLVGIVPVATLMVLIIEGYTLRFSVFWAFIALMALAATVRLETRWRVWADGLRTAAVAASAMSLLLAVVTVFADVIVFTGLQTSLGDIIESLTGGNLLWAVGFMMIIGVVLGAGLPTVPIYLIMALTFAPILARFGVPHAVSHFMAFYMGSLSFIIPPVAVSALITAPIAGTGYWKVCWQILIIATPLFFFPIMFVFAPELLLLGDSVTRTFLVVGASVLALLIMQFGTAGWLRSPLNVWWRAMAFIPAVVLLIGLVARSETLLGVALVLAAAFVLAKLLVAPAAKKVVPAVAGLSNSPSGASEQR